MKGGISADTLAKLREVFRKFEKISKRGDKAFAMTHQVIDALGAPKEEFHDRIARLPVTIRVTTTLDAGREQTRRDYFVSGRLVFSVFLSGPADERVDIPEQPSPESGGPEEETQELPASESLLIYCEYTDPGTQEFFSGECATQQELDDAMAAIAAMDAEVNAAVIEQEESFEEYCAGITDPAVKFDEGCPLNDSEFGLQIQLSVPDGSTDTMWGEESLEPLQPCPISDPRMPAVNRECAVAGVFAGIAVATWIGSKYTAIAVVTSVTAPPAAAVGWAIFGALTAGAAAVYGVATAIQCYRGAN